MAMGVLIFRPRDTTPKCYGAFFYLLRTSFRKRDGARRRSAIFLQRQTTTAIRRWTSPFSERVFGTFFKVQMEHTGRSIGERAATFPRLQILIRTILPI